MSPRALPLSPDDRREALVEATLPLLRQHGRKVTTRQIARAAGVAEGTIFRVYATKDELVEAAIARAFEPGRLQRQIDDLESGLPLRELLVNVVTLFQRRFTEMFGLMAKVGVMAPDQRHDLEARKQFRDDLAQRLTAYLGEHDELRIPVGELLHVLRLLTFSASHPHISEGRILTPDQIVDIVLYGAVHRPERGPERGTD